ncbi:lipoate--protein ligase [Aerococcus tenax]|uniref:lipoate--protein ligase n=2 Tax=Aerococcus tenax TaxID=3078812 RepID=A0A5N1BMX6_9LACT|nr:lipoate--protein ligase [Aerococcus urinae]
MNKEEDLSMFFIDTSRHGQTVYDPIVNQSLDNYLINDLALEGHGLIMYINAPCVIIGKNQNAYAEVDLDYLEKNDITLVRRTGGGGAVYQDYGNIVFENIVVGDTSHYGDFSYYAQPIIDALTALGIEGVQLKGRNDIVVDDLKISGMSMVKVENALAAGETLLFDLDTQQARRVLTPNQDKLKTKGVKSVDKRVSNLKPLLKGDLADLSTEAFKEALLKEIFHTEDLDSIQRYTLTDEDWAIIDQRVADFYGKDEWNYGSNPGFHYYKTAYYPGVGTVAFNFNISDGLITDFKTYGDMSFGQPDQVDQAMIGRTYDQAGIAAGLEAGNYQDNIGKLAIEDLVSLILN